MSPLRDAFRLPAVLVGHRELLMAFVKRELRARIEGSVLGRLWPIIQPMVLFAIYYLVFAKILKVGFSDDLAPHDPEMVGWRSTFYLVTGILPWTVLAEGASRGSGVVLENANLIKKIAFPSELLPCYQTVVFHVYFLVGFVILLALELIVNGSLPSALVWLPLVVLVQFLFVNGLTMFLAAANIFVRDIQQAVPVLVTFWMFTTPVFYDVGALGQQAEAELAFVQDEVVKVQGWLDELDARTAAAGEISEADRQLEVDLQASMTDILERRQKAQEKNEFSELMTEAMSYNPMAVQLDLYRAIFSYGRVEFPVLRLAKLGLIALVVQFLAYAFFLRCKGRFADEV